MNKKYTVRLLCEFARKKAHPSRKQYTAPPTVPFVMIPRSISDMLLTIARFSVEPPVMRGRSHSHASSCLFVRDQKSGCASHFRPCWP
jgi:hypothetical protein